MKFIAPLTEEERVTLQEMYKNHPSFRCRQRAHAVLLNARGYTIPQLWDILETRRDAISDWLDHWEQQGLMGLYDLPRPGRPTIYTEAEALLLKDLVDKEPRRLKQVVVALAQSTGKSASLKTLQRQVKKTSGTVGNAAASP